MEFTTKRKYLLYLKFWRKRWFLITMMAIGSLWSLTFLMFSLLKDSNKLGDSFGAVNALFSGCAFAFLIYTTWMQRKELGLQRNELRLQRKELRLTRDEMVQATKAHQKHVELFQLQIDNERKRFLSEYKPNLLIELDLRPSSKLRLHLSCLINKCILRETITFYDAVVSMPTLHNMVIGTKKDHIDIDFMHSNQKFQFIANYQDIRGNWYHQHFQVLLTEDGHAIKYVQSKSVEIEGMLASDQVFK